MFQLLTIAKREVTSLFYSPVAYLVIFLFLLVEGVLFSILVFDPGNLTEIRRLISTSHFCLFFILPLATMGVFADEFRSGRIEMLRTSPITDFQLVAGKFLGSFLFFLSLVALTFIYIALLVIFGRLDWGQTLTAYLGLILLGSMFISIGLFYSACTQTQMVAALASMITLAFFTFAEIFTSRVPQSFSFFNLFDVPVRSTIRYLTVSPHIDDFAKGVFDTQHLAYFCGFTLFFLFLTYLVIESKKWR